MLRKFPDLVESERPTRWKQYAAHHLHWGIKRIHKRVEPHSLPVNVSFRVNNTSLLTYSWHHNLSYQWITEPFQEVVRQVESALSLENYHRWFKKKCYTKGCDKGGRSPPVLSDQIYRWLKFHVFEVKEAQTVLCLNWRNTFKWEQDGLWLPLLFAQCSFEMSFMISLTHCL